MTQTAAEKIILTDETRAQLVRSLNDGTITQVNGREVWSLFSKQHADVWQNGNVSVNVRGRKAGKQGTLWLKLGETVTVR